MFAKPVNKIAEETKAEPTRESAADTVEKPTETIVPKEDRLRKSLGKISHVVNILPPKIEIDTEIVYSKCLGITPIMFIVIEFILIYCNVTCLLMVTNGDLAKQLDFNVDDISFKFVTCNYFAMWLGLFYCYLAESYIGKKLMNIVAMVLASICPLVTTLSSFPGVKIEDRKYYVQWIVYTVILTVSSGFPRRIYALDQLKLPRDVRLVTRYFFWLEFVTRIGTILAHLPLCFRLGITANYLNHFTVLLIYFIIIAVFVMFDESLLVLTSYFRIIDVHVMCLLNAAINKLRYKTDIKAHWTDYADTEKYSQEIIFDSKIAVEILLILFPMVYAGSLVAVTYYTSIEYQCPILNKEKKILKNLNPEFIYVILDSITLPLVQFAVLPLGKLTGIWKHCLHAIGLALCVIITSGIICTVLESLIQNEMGYLPTYLYGQLRIYNTLPTETSVEAEQQDVGNFQVNAKDKHVFLRLLPGDIEMTFTNVEANINVSKTITVTSDESRSYIISNDGVTESNQPDPIAYSITSYKDQRAQMYVITPHETLTGALVYMNSHAIESIHFFATTDPDFHFSISSRETYSFSFENATHTFEMARDVEIPYNTLYVIVIYTEDGEIRGQVHEVVPPLLLNLLWVLPQVIFLSLARSLIYLSLGTFIAVESPWHARGTLLAFMYLLFNNGFGTRLYVDLTTRTNLANLGVHVGLTGFATFIFFYRSLLYRYRFLAM